MSEHRVVRWIPASWGLAVLLVAVVLLASGVLVPRAFATPTPSSGAGGVGATGLGSDGSGAFVLRPSGAAPFALVGAPLLATTNTRYPFVREITGADTPGGAFFSLTGLAVNDGTGNLFVPDNGSGSGQPLNVFAPSGSFLLAATGDVTPNDAKSWRPVAVAANNTSGRVYVSDNAVPAYGGTKAIEVFDASGGFVSQIIGADVPNGTGFGFAGPGPIAVDQASGDLYVYDTSKRWINVLDASGAYLDRITAPPGASAFSNVTGLAFNRATGRLLVADSGRHTVDEFDGYRDPVTPLAFVAGRDGGNTPQGAWSTGTLTVAANDTTGDVYVGVSTAKVVNQFDATGAYENQIIGTPTDLLQTPAQVTVDQATGQVYVYDAARKVIDVFEPNAVVVPDVTTDPATNVTPTSAALNGTVNPEGVVTTDCHFEYGPDTSYGQRVSCKQSATAIGSGTSPVPVTADLSGLSSGVTYHYRLVAGNANDPNPVLGPDLQVGAPTVASPSATGVAKTSATLASQINPHGVDTTCRFAFVDEAHYDGNATNPYAAGSSASCVAPLGNGSVAVAATANLTGLAPNTTYHYRAEAVNAAGEGDGPDRKFTTDAAAQIHGLAITDLTADGATITAQINPEGDATAYHFEYGSTSSYGTSVPVPDQSIGAGTADVTVTAQLTGLAPNTTYHVRVVATNAAGTARSGDHTFGYHATESGLPDNRAYEQVTPVKKNGAQFDAGVFMPPPKVSGGGNRVIAASIQCLPGATSCTANRQSEGSVFALDRTPSAWMTTQLSPSATRFNANTPVSFDPDDGTALFTANVSPGDTDQIVGRRADGSLDVIGPLGVPSSGAIAAPFNRNASTSDLSHVVFAAKPETLGWPFDTTTPGSSRTGLYEYVGSGNSQPILVGVNGGHGSTAIISQCGTELGDGPGAMSQDGRTIFFATRPKDGACPASSVGPPVGELYARINESRTVPLSRRSTSACTTSDCRSSVPANATFAAASEDGSKVLFTSRQQLTDDATQGSMNMYLYDFTRSSGDELVDVSAGDSSGDGPGVKGLAAQSADGSHAYFLATGVLTRDRNDRGQTPTAGANNLYVFAQDATHPDGRLAFIASVPDADADAFLSTIAEVNVTPDGRFLVFPSHGPLTADVTSGGGAAQIFRYDARSDRLIRISVGQDGYNDNGNAGDPSLCAGQPFACTADASLVRPRYTVPRRDPTMSHDGAYVFFQSPAALTPQALNYVPNDTSTGAAPAYAQNVYEYHDGHVSLISDGKDTSLARAGTGVEPLLGTDATGKNVFFKSVSSLVPGDTDGGQLDIYDARVCTETDPCITSPAPVLVCEGDLCQGTPSPSPAIAFPGTAIFAAQVGATKGASPSPRSTGKLRVSKIKTVRGTSTRVNVRVSGKGKLRTSGSGLRRSSKTAKKAGTYRVSVRLSQRARRTLARKHRVQVRVTVRFTPQTGKTQRVRVHATFRPKKRRHHQKSSSRSARRVTVLSSDVRKGR